eukprot:jgi/Chrpa1/4868/Chrysochromulina_OHIO_Genome00014357-RA
MKLSHRTGMQRFLLWCRWLQAPLQASAIGTSGDLVCQLAVEGKTLSRIDTRRSLSFSIFGFLYSGIFQRALYLRFDQIFGVGQDLRTVSLKVASDSLLHGPFLYIPTFCISTAVLQGSSSEEVWERFRSNWAPMVQAYLGIWPATMGLMFYAIPVPSRILYISTIAFAEKMVLSALVERSKELIFKVPGA